MSWCQSVPGWWPGQLWFYGSNWKALCQMFSKKSWIHWEQWSFNNIKPPSASDPSPLILSRVPLWMLSHFPVPALTTRWLSGIWISPFWFWSETHPQCYRSSHPPLSKSKQKQKQKHRPPNQNRCIPVSISLTKPSPRMNHDFQIPILLSCGLICFCGELLMGCIRLCAESARSINFFHKML